MVITVGVHMVITVGVHKVITVGVQMVIICPNTYTKLTKLKLLIMLFVVFLLNHLWIFLATYFFDENMRFIISISRITHITFQGKVQ